MAGPKTVYLIRHGQAEHNILSVYRVHLPHLDSRHRSARPRVLQSSGSGCFHPLG